MCFLGDSATIPLACLPAHMVQFPEEEALLHHSQCGHTDFFLACLLFCCINAPLGGWFPEVQVEQTTSWGLGPACLGSQGLDDE